jgi:O-antigen ligase
MNSIREISITIMKAAIVTVAVVLGFCAGSALGLPVWLQAVFLIPAMLLFCRLSGQRRPHIWKMIGFVGLLSIFVLLVSFGLEYVPKQDFWYYYMLILLVAPFGPILNWFERRFFPKEHISEQDAPSDGDKHPV